MLAAVSGLFLFWVGVCFTLVNASCGIEGRELSAGQILMNDRCNCAPPLPASCVLPVDDRQQFKCIPGVYYTTTSIPIDNTRGYTPWSSRNGTVYAAFRFTGQASMLEAITCGMSEPQLAA